MLTPSERKRVLQDFNAMPAPWSPDRLIPELFEEQVQLRPDAIAIRFQEQELTYADLDRRANQLAHFLRERGVGPDRRVGICVERGIEMIVGLLGILKAGGAYVPVDANYPAKRVQHILRDSAPVIVLTTARVKAILSTTAARVVALDADWAQIAAEPVSKPVIEDLQPRHLAYVIYTSGSTGAPKGVMVEHRTVTRFLVSIHGWFRFEHRDVWTLFHSFAFDFSVLEIWGALVYGSELVIVPHEVTRSPDDFYALVCRERVTVLSQTPSAFRQLTAAQERSTRDHALQTLVLGGEAVDVTCLERWYRRNDQARPLITNMYGPTETTVFVTCCRMTPATAMQLSSGSPIGKPIPHSRLYVLDENGEPVAVGVTGEIHIGGLQVARGYLNRAEMTAQRFRPDPFVGDPQGRLYKTGDLGRWLPDGSLEYLGRNDHQVKLRGFRVELGEIETHLVRHAQVSEAAVIVREDEPGEQRLVAYVTPGGGSVEIEQLRTHLQAVVPEYMVPSAFVVLQALPLTANAKLDRSALPPPPASAYVSREFQAPQGEREELLAKIWAGLLGLERVGRDDNFFELGGHSLLIVEMTQRLRQVGVAVEPRHAFESRTLAALASALTSDPSVEAIVPPNLIPPGSTIITPHMLPLVSLTAEHIDVIVHTVPGGASNIKDIYPLTPLQNGMLFHHLLDAHSGDTYILPTVLSLSSRQRLDELIAALQRVIDRHDILRTAILWERLPQPVQVVYRDARLPVQELMLDADRDCAAQLREWLEPERQRLNLWQAPLLQLQVARDPRGSCWYALLQIHHVVDDAVSLRMLITEVVAFLDGRADDLPEPVSYRNHVAHALRRAAAHDAQTFFRSKLADVDEPTLSFGLADVHGGGSRIEQASEMLDPVLARRLRTRARQLGISPAALFHAAWALVVARTSGRDDVVFGSVLLGRLNGCAGAQRIMGLFVNTLPLRLRLRQVTAQQLVGRIHCELMELVDYEQSSLTVAQRASGVARSTPLFNSVLNYRHSEPDPQAKWDSTSGIRVIGHQYRTNYPIGLSVDDLGGDFALIAQTDRSVEPKRLVGYMQQALRSVVQALEDGTHDDALTLEVLPEDERTQLLRTFNDTYEEVPHDKLIHELFEAQVTRTPAAVAIEHLGRSLSYAELNTRANKLARCLRSRGVGPDRLVALCVERGLDMLVAMFGVLKAGGAYLPLDATNPVARLKHILDDAQPQVVLAHSSLRAALPPATPGLVVLDTLAREIEASGDSNLDSRSLQLEPGHLAYVIYTSGSTGAPKGVMIEHRNLVNYSVQSARRFDVAAGNGSLLCTSISFDLMLTGLYPTLLGGRTVRVCPEQRGMPLLAQELPLHSNLAPLKLTPSHLALLEPALREGHLLGCVRVLVLGGEQLHGRVLRQWREKSPSTRTFNHYGPTETTVGCVVHEVLDDTDGPVPIGRPIGNTQVYILDARLQPVPLGVTGELYIGGAGVARGYLNRPDLTSERFVRDPFSAAPGARLYRSGDLARWRSDGVVEYLGRSDHQVKIRGFRIELQEIEAQLVRNHLVKEAVVMARETARGENRLIAYVTPIGPIDPSEQDLRAHVRAALPEYMLPSAFVVLAQLPLTANGKLDRRALPAPEMDLHVNGGYEAPIGELEEVVADVWCELLGIERVGRRDDFFDLGGHSLLAMQVIVRTQHLLCVRMPMRSLFEFRTLELFVAELARLRIEQTPDGPACEKHELDELLGTVAALSDSEVRDLVHRLRQEARP